MRLETDNGKKIKLGRLIGKGGQGKVYQVQNDPFTAVKLYEMPTKQQENKIRAMVAIPETNRPSSQVAAWPLAHVYRLTGPWWWPRKKAEFIGYTMPYIVDAHPIFCFYTPRERKEHQWNFTWWDMHVLASSVSMVFEQFHKHNLVIGDVNCNNILVNPELTPILIDVDSIQLSSTYTTDVGFEEYTPPELVGRSLKQVVRTQYHDLFGLGYLIFQLLMNGCSPFAGVPKLELSWPYIDKRCKDLGIFPFYGNPYVAPPPGMPNISVFHPEIAAGFIACFTRGRRDPAARPGAQIWTEKLRTAARCLTRCKWNSNHMYSAHLNYCPWCE